MPQGDVPEGVMLVKHYISSKAICPFYKHENRFVIFCQGVERESVLHHAFPTPSSCFNFKAGHCRAEYTKCPIHSMLSNIPSITETIID